MRVLGVKLGTSASVNQPSVSKTVGAVSNWRAPPRLNEDTTGEWSMFCPPINIKRLLEFPHHFSSNYVDVYVRIELSIGFKTQRESLVRNIINMYVLRFEHCSSMLMWCSGVQ